LRCVEQKVLEDMKLALLPGIRVEFDHKNADTMTDYPLHMHTPLQNEMVEYMRARLPAQQMLRFDICSNLVTLATWAVTGGSLANEARVREPDWVRLQADLEGRMLDVGV
jgi:hypothetical protein